MYIYLFIYYLFIYLFIYYIYLFIHFWRKQNLHTNEWVNKWINALSWRRPLSYRNQSIDFQSKSMDWFLYDNSLRHERVKKSDWMKSF